MTKILIAEDEDYAIAPLVITLIRLNHKVDVVETEAEALTRLSESLLSGHLYNVILTDWHLRQGNGSSLIRWLRHTSDIYKNIPVIASSSMQYRFNDVLEDPVLKHNTYSLPKIGFDDMWDEPNTLATLQQIATLQAT